MGTIFSSTDSRTFEAYSLNAYALKEKGEIEYDSEKGLISIIKL